MLTATFIIGWIWSICQGVAIYKKSLDYGQTGISKADAKATAAAAAAAAANDTKPTPTPTPAADAAADVSDAVAAK